MIASTRSAHGASFAVWYAKSINGHMFVGEMGEVSLEGGCYCGAVRYIAEGEPVLRAQCHCRACQYFSGGAPNLFMLVPAEGFAYTKGAPKTYRRPDKADAVTREFCAVCGTHMISRRPGLRPIVLKIGTLDNPLVYGGAQKGDLHGRRSAFPSHCGWRARL
jgi:hypothetical protein